MSYLKDRIRSIKFPVKEVEMPPHWGGNVFIRKLTVGEMMYFRKKENEEIDAVKAAAMFLCDENGDQLFPGAEYTELNNFPFDELMLIINAGQEFNVPNVGEQKNV